MKNFIGLSKYMEGKYFKLIAKEDESINNTKKKVTIFNAKIFNFQFIGSLINFILYLIFISLTLLSLTNKVTEYFTFYLQLSFEQLFEIQSQYIFFANKSMVREDIKERLKVLYNNSTYIPITPLRLSFVN